MMIEKLEELSSEINLGDVLVKEEDVILAMDGKGDLKSTFPVPNCERCVEKCCPAGVAVSLFDVARFMDMGLDSYLAGAFEGYIELFLSDDGGNNVKISRPYMASGISGAKGCVFLTEEKKCSIYDRRPFICRAFPVGIRIDEDRNRLAIWMGGCQNYDISDNKEAFLRLLGSAVQDYNEKVTANSLLMYSRNRLRESSFGKYMEDDWKILIDSNKKNRELEKQVKDLQQVVERLRLPQDHNALIERIQAENDWLKERLINIENEMKQQSARAHSIISDLTNQVSSEYRRIFESILSCDAIAKHEKQNSRSFWRK